MFPFALLLTKLEMLDFGLKHPPYKPQRDHLSERIKPAVGRETTWRNLETQQRLPVANKEPRWLGERAGLGT
jgi:hypothetical protein